MLENNIKRGIIIVFGIFLLILFSDVISSDECFSDYEGEKEEISIENGILQKTLKEHHFYSGTLTSFSEKWVWEGNVIYEEKYPARSGGPESLEEPFANETEVGDYKYNKGNLVYNWTDDNPEGGYAEYEDYEVYEICRYEPPYNCEIRQSSCNSGEKKILALSSETNAHAALVDSGSDYNYFLCCDFDFGSVNQNADNAIVRLSSETNAHAEIPSETNYDTIVGYEDLECISGSSCSSEYPISVLSLSSETNAHLGPYNDYETKICCKSGEEVGCIESCSDGGFECGTHSDNCGGTLECGSCDDGETCSSDGSCVDCDSASCSSLGYDCGTHDDGCGGTLDCGSCDDGETCSSDGSCTNCLDTTSCSSLGHECGIHDICGESTDCGSCDDGETCVLGECVSCTPETCSSLGYDCGTHDDGCGGTLDCGSCDDGETCSSDGSCVDCDSASCSSLGYDCGTHDDGCGGTLDCGSCDDGETCTKYGECIECESASCSSLGFECGTHGDNCGGVIDCGNCSSGETCYLGSCCEPYCEDDWECGSDGCGGSCAECPGEYESCDEQTHMCVSPVAHWESEGGNYLSEISILPDSTSVNAVVEDLVTFSEGEEVKFMIYEDDPVSDDTIKTLTTSVDSDSKARVTWDITEEDIEAGKGFFESEDDLTLYFKAYDSEDNEILKSSDLDVKEVKDSDYCEINEISFCNSYDTKSDCEQDLCNVANESVENNDPDTTCGETYTDSKDCEYFINCLCEWDNENEKCQPTSTDEVIDCPDDIDLPEDLSPSDLGVTCVQDEVIDDDCSDGFLTYSWEGYAEWSEENSFNSIPSGFEEKDFVQDEEDSYHYDPDKKSEDCKLSEEETVRCSSQLELFFFEYYQFLICLLLVVFVYFLLNNKKRIKCNQK